MYVTLHTRHDITLAVAEQVGWRDTGVAIAPDAIERMAASRAAFERLIADPDVTVYGVTSGYGQHASVRLAPEDRLRHARRPPTVMQANAGTPFPERVTRIMVLARLANFLDGHAAVRPELAQAVAAMLDAPLPLVPCTGAVSAGEILPLSWLFGPLLERFEPREKELLALVSGAPVAAALAADGAAHPLGRVLSTGGYHNAAAWPALNVLAMAYADLCTIADRIVSRLLDGRTSGLPDQLGGGDGERGYLSTLGFAVVGYGEAARRAAQAVFLPGSESGGFVQNDTAVPTALAWEGQDTAGRMLDAALGAVAVVAAQALLVTGREAPPGLARRLAAWRAAAPPPNLGTAPGQCSAAVTALLQAEIYPPSA